MNERNPTWDPDNPSAIAREMRRFPPRVLAVFGLNTIAADVLDAVAASVYDVLDEGVGRTWEERFERISGHFERFLPEGIDEDKLAQLSKYFEGEFVEDVKSRIERLQSPSGKLFVKRLLGAKRYHLLVKAAEEDWALMLVGVRRVVRATMPLVQALEDAMVPLSPKDRATVEGMENTQDMLLGGALKLEQSIGGFFDKRDWDLISLGFPIRDEEASTMTIELEELVSVMRAMINIETDQRAAELGEVLSRKLRGFEQALETSDDGVAQAATSLVEFIDRLLRSAFTTDEVLAWLAKYYPDDKGATYERDGEIRPTKRGSALCFAYAGRDPAGSTLEGMVAMTLVRVRTAAEKIKHADEGTEEEAEDLRILMQALRGATTVIIRFSWAFASDGRWEQLQGRFRAKPAPADKTKAPMSV